LADDGEESQTLSDKLAKILRERFPNDSFIQVECPENLDDYVFHITFNPLTYAKTLLIGIGIGGLAAYKVQHNPLYRGVSVFAACPPPGVSSQPSGGPRVIVYGSKYGVYGLPSFLFNKQEDATSIQLYGLPSLIHGPKLALGCIAYLVGKYMQGEDLSEAIFTASGNDTIIPAKGLE
jgi:hypothetical protein